jgi:hypothetical protein
MKRVFIILIFFGVMKYPLCTTILYSRYETLRKKSQEDSIPAHYFVNKDKS